ncbi:hypothetical protein ACGF0J_37970 [Nonomuraea sp. NPDC047897]|uniref:hypothetical protein n=1 Tax=Nonomuraea sp. NPDC047897 TaxID=3364346 RepID=UPI00370FB983
MRHTPALGRPQLIDWFRQSEVLAYLAKEDLSMRVPVSIQRDEPGHALRPQPPMLGELLCPAEERGVEVNESPVEVEEGEALHEATLDVNISPAPAAPDPIYAIRDAAKSSRYIERSGSSGRVQVTTRGALFHALDWLIGAGLSEDPGNLQDVSVMRPDGLPL